LGWMQSRLLPVIPHEERSQLMGLRLEGNVLTSSPLNYFALCACNYRGDSKNHFLGFLFLRVGLPCLVSAQHRGRALQKR
jgi:hypothetical protein